MRRGPREFGQCETRPRVVVEDPLLVRVETSRREGTR